MATVQASSKSGIIAHMNKDHRDSLIRYLEHYHKLSGWRAYDAKMTDIDLKGLDVTASGKSYHIPFHPPMNSLSEARARLVEMDKYSALFLHKSDITVKRYVPPYGKFLVAAIGTVGILYTTHYPSLWAPTGPIGKHLGTQIQPIAQNIVIYLAPRLLKYIAITHALEVAFFMYYVLPKHSVSARAPQFWLWCISVFIEGIGAQGRFLETVQKARIAKEKQRH